MEKKDLWKKLSGSINYYIKKIWRTELLRDSNQLCDGYISYLVGNKKPYLYLDKRTNQLIELTDNDIYIIRQEFIKRIENKRVKYSSELSILEEAL